MIEYISKIVARSDRTLHVIFGDVIFGDGIEGVFDVNPYIADEVFLPLENADEFMKIRNGGYFVEWECGADLSADTLRAHIKSQNDGVV